MGPLNPSEAVRGEVSRQRGRKGRHVRNIHFLLSLTRKVQPTFFMHFVALCLQDPPPLNRITPRAQALREMLERELTVPAGGDNEALYREQERGLNLHLPAEKVRTRALAARSEGLVSARSAPSAQLTSCEAAYASLWRSTHTHAWCHAFPWGSRAS